MNKDLYCKLYVNYSGAQLSSIVARILEVKSTGSWVDHEMLEADIKVNKDVDVSSSADPERAFLFYPHLIEIESTDVAEERSFIELIGMLISALRTQCGEVVAACDFEDQLPK